MESDSKLVNLIPGLNEPTGQTKNLRFIVALLIVFIIITFVATWFGIGISTFSERLTTEPTATNLTASRQSDIQTSFFAPTPYPYPPSCGFIEDEMTYALNIAKQNEPNLESSPLYPEWKRLLAIYLADQKASKANPSDSVLAAAAMMSRKALDAYEDVNNFRPFLPEEKSGFANKWMPFTNKQWQPFIGVNDPARSARFTVKDPSRSARFTANPGIVGSSVAKVATTQYTDNVASQGRTMGVGSDYAKDYSNEALMLASQGL